VDVYHNNWRFQHHTKILLMCEEILGAFSNRFSSTVGLFQFHRIHPLFTVLCQNTCFQSETIGFQDVQKTTSLNSQNLFALSDVWAAVRFRFCTCVMYIRHNNYVLEPVGDEQSAKCDEIGTNLVVERYLGRLHTILRRTVQLRRATVFVLGTQ